MEWPRRAGRLRLLPLSSARPSARVGWDMSFQNDNLYPVQSLLRKPLGMKGVLFFRDSPKDH